jgi:hypothetical protein
MHERGKPVADGEGRLRVRLAEIDGDHNDMVSMIVSAILRLFERNGKGTRERRATIVDSNVTQTTLPALVRPDGAILCIAVAVS